MGRRKGHLFHPIEGGTSHSLLGHGPVFRDFNFSMDESAVAPYEAARDVVVDSAILDGLAAHDGASAWVAQRTTLTQGFVLAGTVVGIFTIIVGVGPRTVPDILYHLGIVGILSWGLLQAARMQPGSSQAARSWPRRAAQVVDFAFSVRLEVGARVQPENEILISIS